MKYRKFVLNVCGLRVLMPFYLFYSFIALFSAFYYSSSFHIFNFFCYSVTSYISTPKMSNENFTTMFALAFALPPPLYIHIYWGAEGKFGKCCKFN